MHDVFEFKAPSHYSLRNDDTLVRRRVRTARNGLLSLSHVGAQLWDTIPLELRSSPTLPVFKTKVRALENLSCRCHLCCM